MMPYVILDLKQTAYYSVTAVIVADNPQDAKAKFSKSIGTWRDGFVAVLAPHYCGQL